MVQFSNPLERWNSRFSQDAYLFGEEPNRYLVRQAHRLHRAAKTLSVADGEGRNSVWLAAQGHQVTAFDFSAPAVAKARLLAERHRVSVDWRCCDWLDFDWQAGEYDNVVGIFFQFVDPERRQVLFDKMVASLKPSGVLLIQGYHIDQLQFNTGGPGVLDHLYTPELMREALPGVSIEDLQVYQDVLQEGSGHCGMSALLGYVGVKKPVSGG